MSTGNVPPQGGYRGDDMVSGSNVPPQGGYRGDDMVSGSNVPPQGGYRGDDMVSGSRTAAPQAGYPSYGRETKPSFLTSELIVYALSVISVLIACLVVDINEDGQGFSAYQGWFLATLLTIGYLISRGLAKSGSRDRN
jgi:hypothetical protein